MKNQFNLLSIGFDEHSFNDLKVKIDRYAMGVNLVRSINPGSVNNINALIIDFDEDNLDEKLSFCRELFSNKPIIGLFSTPIEIDNIFTLKNPLNRSELGLILNKISGKELPRKQKQKDIRAIYSKPESLLHYPINNCFQSHLINAWKVHKNLNKPIKLKFLNKPVLVLFEDKVSTFISSKRLKSLCALTIHDHSISTVILLKSPEVRQSLDATFFIAQVVLWSSSGRLPEGINSTDIVQLTGSDKQYSLPKVENSDLIKYCWINLDCSLQETEQILEVGQANIFSYFSMLYALDFAEVYSPGPSSKTKYKNNKNVTKWKWLKQRFNLKFT